MRKNQGASIKDDPVNPASVKSAQRVKTKGECVSKTTGLYHDLIREK